MTKKDEIKSFLRDYPNASNADIQRHIGCSRRHISRARAEVRSAGYPLTLTPKNEQDFCKLQLMAGLKKKELPKRYREMIADLVVNVELALERQPDIPIERYKSEKEAAVLCVSDFHSGKQVYDDRQQCLYNKDICAFKLSLLRKRVVKLLTHNLKQGTIDEFHMLLLGDLVDGSGIYPGQELHQDLTCVSDQISLMVAGLWEIVRDILRLGLRVYLHCVRGNHGRQGKYAPAENNFDYLVYQMLYMIAHYEAPAVVVEYATNTDYLNTVVKGRNVHLRHIAPPQAETAAGKAKFGGWKGIHDYEILCYGHLHHPSNGTFQECELVMNGSPVGIDDLAERMAVKSRPSQTLFGIDPVIGQSFTYRVYLDIFGDGGEAEELLKRYPMLRVY